MLQWSGLKRTSGYLSPSDYCFQILLILDCIFVEEKNPSVETLRGIHENKQIWSFHMTK